MKSIKTSLAKYLFVMAIIIAALSFSNHSHAQEQKEELGFILSMTEFKIKFGQDEQFSEGVKAWKKCYLENGGTWTWNMWHRVQGEVNVYILTSAMQKWAEMDEEVVLHLLQSR